MDKVNLDTKISNSTATPPIQVPGKPQMTATPVSASSISSQAPSSGFSLSNFCDKIVSLVQRGWNWIKENIFGVKPERAPPVQPTSVPNKFEVQLTGNPTIDFKNSPTLVINLKKENQQQFLQQFVDQFLNNPKQFFESIITKLQYGPTTDEFGVATFFYLAGMQLGKTGKLSEQEVLDLYFKEIRRERTEVEFKALVEEINKNVCSNANKDKVKAAMDVYQQWILGSYSEENKAAVEGVD